jgi:two-component system nitrogen regulation response regulator GlnG
MKDIWVVDDDQSIRFVLEKALAREQFSVRSFANARDVIGALADDEPQVLVSDIRMPGGSGLDLLAKVKERLPGLPVIIMTAFSDLDSAVSAFQGGAFEYLPKPFDLPKAVELIRRAVEESLREAVAAERPVKATRDSRPGAGDAGGVPRHRAAVAEPGDGADHRRERHRQGAGRAGRCTSTVRAAAVHSLRINTAAIPKDLLESELFGHERGAFTGAQTMRRGRFEQAEGGTLFLDEIGDMPPTCRRGCCACCPTGSSTAWAATSRCKANVRVIAATHQNLEERVRDGLFREDLFHRLNVIRLRLPPLRERREDVPCWRQFLQKSAKRAGRGGQAPVTDEALARAGGFRLSGQCAPAREPLSLAHRDGAGAGGRTQGPAARAERVDRRGRHRAVRPAQPMAALAAAPALPSEEHP